MLLAEINGKHCPEVLNLEDMLTSCVFGNLRLISPQIFWDELFARAIDAHGSSLGQELEDLKQVCSTFNRLRVEFWPRLDSLEPDLMMIFDDGQHKLLVTIEVKLHATMSNTADRNQLAAYASLLQNYEQAEYHPFRPIIYLTPQSTLTEIVQSEEIFRHTALGKSAKANLYSLEWQDVAEVAQKFKGQQTPDILDEVARFLAERGLIRFRKFRPPQGRLRGHFYQSVYFGSSVWRENGFGGSFYAK